MASGGAGGEELARRAWHECPAVPNAMAGGFYFLQPEFQRRVS